MDKQNTLRGNKGAGNIVVSTNHESMRLFSKYLEPYTVLLPSFGTENAKVAFHSVKL